MGSNVFVQELQIVDCLELLSENYRNHIVRNMAIERLKLAKDDELEMFMVQLVQSIKNESNYINPHTDIDDDVTLEEIDQIESGDPEESASLAGTTNDFHMVKDEESADPVVKFLTNPMLLSSRKRHKLAFKVPKLDSPLANFIIDRACKNSNLMTFLYWDLKVEVEDEWITNRAHLNTVSSGGVGLGFEEIDFVQDQIIDDNNDDRRAQMRATSHIFEKTILNLIWKLANSEDGEALIKNLRSQVYLVGQLHNIAQKIKVDYKKESTPRKVEILKSLLADKHKKKSTIKSITDGTGTLIAHRSISMLHVSESDSLVDFPPISAPIDPNVKLCGCYVEESAVFKSSLNPLKISFKTKDGGKYPLMFKIGDDLRQDQFVVQIISVMDKILQNENLDLRLKPYKIMATAPVEGFIEFVPNSSLSSILANYNNSILAYLQHFNPDPTAPHGVFPEAMDNYVRSCAGTLSLSLR
ncbi:unnamed protein product [Ambrosiozyma monospora]|uniref:Unnamed protein product n=1 Tax=Ambrosiozyma monospora TaxID=43982 RepID=A0ACB5TCC7_AMBMO|nr:unnamed protein product [Ambrosiozyma monospora]